jgi:hypothetical protein
MQQKPLCEDLVDLLPARFTLPIAALMLGVTEGRLRDLAFEQGQFNPERSAEGANWYFPRNDIERYVARPLTPADYLRACRRHDHRLACYARANGRRRGAIPA